MQAHHQNAKGASPFSCFFFFFFLFFPITTGKLGPIPFIGTFQQGECLWKSNFFFQRELYTWREWTVFPFGGWANHQSLISFFQRHWTFWRVHYILNYVKIVLSVKIWKVKKTDNRPNRHKEYSAEFEYEAVKM